VKEMLNIQKKAINAFILFVLTGILIFYCSCSNDNIKVSLHQMQVPVLKFKEINPVLKVKMVAPDDNRSYKVTSITVSTEGTDDLTDIKAVRLFYLGKDTLLTRYETSLKRTPKFFDPVYNDDFKPLHYGQEQIPSVSITFKGDQVLEPGENNFYITYELTDQANLHHKVDAGCTQVIFAGQGPVIPTETDPPVKQRIGVAVRQHMDDNVHTYRVPGLATTNEGSLLAIYDVRRQSSRDL